MVACGAQLRDGCVENGKYKKDYTIDRRCYVTDEQKKQSPYNATVGLIGDKNEIYCTGTIFRDNQDISLQKLFQYNTPLPAQGLYVYTAAHCAKNGAQQLKIRLQNGQEIITEKVNVGGRKDIPAWSDNWVLTKDLAVYQMPENAQTDIPYADIEYSDWESKKPLKLIGYGAAAILNNKEIHDVKQKYVGFLKTEFKNKIKELQDKDIANRTEQIWRYNGILNELEEQGENSIYVKGLFSDDNNGDIVVNYYTFDSFVKFIKSALPTNELLKVSECDFSDERFCQAWMGNSGGGLFSSDNKLIALASNMEWRFGGANHMRMGENDSELVQVQNKQNNIVIMHKPITPNVEPLFKDEIVVADDDAQKNTATAEQEEEWEGWDAEQNEEEMDEATKRMDELIKEIHEKDEFPYFPDY